VQPPGRCAVLGPDARTPHVLSPADTWVCVPQAACAPGFDVVAVISRLRLP
jgi:hypothetical protein